MHSGGSPGLEAVMLLGARVLCKLKNAHYCAKLKSQKHAGPEIEKEHIKEEAT